jgi:hypothetical protein
VLIKHDFQFKIKIKVILLNMLLKIDKRSSPFCGFIALKHAADFVSQQ